MIRYGGGLLVLIALVLGGCKDKKDCLTCPDGGLQPPLGAIFSATGGEVTFFSLTTNTIESVKHMTGFSVSAQFSPTGTVMFATQNQSDGLAIYALPEFELMENIDFGANPIDLAINSQGNLAYVLSANASLRRIVIASNDVDTTHVGLSPRRMRVMPGVERQAWVACRRDSEVWIVNLQTMSTDSVMPMPAVPTDIAFTADGSTAFLAMGDNGGVQIRDPFTLELISTLGAGTGPLDIDVDEGGQWLAASDSSAGRVRLWRLATEEFWDITVGPAAGRVRFTRDGSRCYVLSTVRNHVVCVSTEGAEPAVIDTIEAPATVRELALWETGP